VRTRLRAVWSRKRCVGRQIRRRTTFLRTCGWLINAIRSISSFVDRDLAREDRRAAAITFLEKGASIERFEAPIVADGAGNHHDCQPAAPVRPVPFYKVELGLFAALLPGGHPVGCGQSASFGKNSSTILKGQVCFEFIIVIAE
jgi:hypothetical protein